MSFLPLSYSLLCPTLPSPAFLLCVASFLPHSSCTPTHSQHLNLHLPPSHSQEKDRNLRRITRMVLVVVAVFIVCWTPIHIIVIITALINIPSSTLQTITWHFCIALGYTNRYTSCSSLRIILNIHFSTETISPKKSFIII